MAGISWFLVCTIFNLCWGDNSQETQEKDCKKGRNIAINDYKITTRKVPTFQYCICIPYVKIFSGCQSGILYIPYDGPVIDTFTVQR